MRNDWKTLTLQEASELPEPGRGKAIYFLWKDAELLYIGASTQVSERVTRQAQLRDYGSLSSSAAVQAKPRIPFNRATALPMESVELMADVEKVLIRRFWPPWNDRIDDGDQVWRAHIAEERASSKTSL